MSNIQKQHKISPAIAWLTIQKFIIFYCPLDGKHTTPKTPGVFYHYMIYDMYDMFEKRSLCRNHHRPVDLLPYKPEADHLHDDRCNPGYRIRQEQESQ